MYSIVFSLSPEGISISEELHKRQPKRNKGKSIIDFPSSYCVLDIETTGLNPAYDEIIEVGALKIKDNQVIDKFQSLVQPDDLEDFDPFIEDLTGITREMLADAPFIEDVLPRFLQFLSDSVIIGYNVNFDINFIYDNTKTLLGRDFQNNYVDVLRIARRVHPTLEHHRLKDMIELHNISVDKEHRALSDCYSTQAVFLALQDRIKDDSTLEEFASNQKRKYCLDARDIVGDPSKFNADCPLYHKTCVFTGKLDNLTRKEAMQIVADLGGYVGNNVTKETNYLILGNYDYVANVKNGKSAKFKKAEKLKLSGQDIEIIPESVFYDMINFD